MNNSYKYQAGVIGAGKFGIALANIMTENGHVLLYARRAEVIEKIRNTRKHKNQEIHPAIELTDSLEALASQCELIIPVIPSANFPQMLDDIAPFVYPYHKIIHATKGLFVDLEGDQELSSLTQIRKEQVLTMSKLILARTAVKRVGCIAGPNLAWEIAEGQPAATVIASPFDEVIQAGTAMLRVSRFRVHASHDLQGIELAGVLKNIMAISAGLLHGLGYGDNTMALLITRGIAEIIRMGHILGADTKTFLGLAGIGDLVATCSSPHSRNFTVGYRIAKGESLDAIIADMEEVAEGVKTTFIAKALTQSHGVSAPITQAIARILKGEMEIERAIRLLMEFPFTEDVDFI